MQEISFGEYEDADLDGCVSLLSRTFPDRSDRATFQWRFGGKTRKKPIMIVARDGGEIISFNSWIPWQFSYEGEAYLGYQAGEAATSPEYRRRGVWKNVLSLGYDVALAYEVDFLFGFPHEISCGGLLKTGYVSVSTLSFCLRPISPFCRMHGEINKHIPDISSLALLDQRDKISPEIDDDYCKWRYIDNTKKFDVVEYNDESSRAIFFIRQKKWKGLNEAILLDCQFNNYNDLFVEKAFRYLDGVLSRRVLYVRTFFNEHSDRGSILKKYFPLRVRSKNETLMIKPISERIDPAVFLNRLKWDIMPHCIDEY